MAKTLTELIAEASAGDDLLFTGPDGATFKLGDIRSFRGTVDAETKALTAKRQEAERIATEADTLLKGLQLAIKEQEKKNNPQPTKSEDWRKNPLYEDILPVLDELKSVATQARQDATNLKASLDQSQAIYALERMRRQWAEAKSKPKDKKFEEVVAEVLAQKEIDSMGLPTIEKYLYRSTEQERLDAYAAEKVAEAEKGWNKKQAAAAIPKPGKFQVNKEVGKSPIKNLSELDSEAVAKAAAEDPEFANAISGTVQ